MNESGLILKPIEGQWFKVDPTKLKIGMFKTKKQNFMQEETRQLILDAFAEMEKYPERYKKRFYTLIPSKMETGKTIKELQINTQLYNGCMANWIEQALEWAQRISNGDTWENLCDKPDLKQWYRMIRWKTGSVRFVGGTADGIMKYSATTVGKTDWLPTDKVYHTVPLIVRYE